MSRRNVYLPGETPPDDDPNDPFVTIPKGNDRMWKIMLVNHHRGKRRRSGTATAYRLFALMQGIKRRHPRCTKSMAHTEPVVMRTFRGGPVVAVIDILAGPVASIATKH